MLYQIGRIEHSCAPSASQINVMLQVAEVDRSHPQFKKQKHLNTADVLTRVVR